MPDPVRQPAAGKMILKTIDNPRISRLTRETHEVLVPPLCPKTANPIAGSTLTITYESDAKLLEVYSLNETSPLLSARRRYATWNC